MKRKRPNHRARCRTVVIVRDMGLTDWQKFRLILSLLGL
jgi:hypothetical protein